MELDTFIPRFPKNTKRFPFHSAQGRATPVRRPQSSAQEARRQQTRHLVTALVGRHQVGL